MLQPGEQLKMSALVNSKCKLHRRRAQSRLLGANHA